MKKLTQIAVLILIFLSTISVSAQSFLMQNTPEDKIQIGIRFQRPQFKFTSYSESDYTALSGVYDLTVSVPVSRQIKLVGNLPFSAFSLEDYHEEGIGSIFLGLEVHTDQSKTHAASGTVGLGLPTASEENLGANLLGLFTDSYEIFKMLPDILTLYQNSAYKFQLPAGLILRVEAGPTVLIPTEGDGDSEAYIHYGMAAGFQLKYATVFAEWTGNGILTEEYDSFGDRFIHAVTIGVQAVNLPVRPGIYLKFFADEDMEDFVKNVFGVKVDVSI